jgi:hypothetical protein
MSQFVGLANNTKWSELQAFMSELGTQAPFWRTQSTNGFIYPQNGWDGDWTYHFRLGDYKDIEWCEMAPREPDGISLEQIVGACSGIGFELEVNDSVIRIIGYRRI